MDFLHDTETWIAAGFAIIIAVILYRRVPRMIGVTLDQRAATIKVELEAAQNLRTEAEALLAQYKRKAAEAEQEAEIILTEARAEAERFSAESRVALTAQIERRSQQAQDKIAQAETQAMAEIRALAADAATAAAQRLIAARLDDKRSGALIAQSIAELPVKLN
jgi:F-type H+-transporting ATPase subunit b